MCIVLICRWMKFSHPPLITSFGGKQMHKLCWERSDMEARDAVKVITF